MVAVNIISRKRLTQSGAPELRLKPEGRLSRLENRLPFLSPAFPGQSTALVVPPPLGADDKAISADDKQYSSALTTPDSKKCPRSTPAGLAVREPASLARVRAGSASLARSSKPTDCREPNPPSPCPGQGPLPASS